MKWLKRFLITAIVIILIGIGAIITLLMTINPNHFKPQIERLVKQKTGQTLVISGPIHLSLYPWIGLKVSRVRLNNPPGYGSKPFAQIQNLGIAVALWPLLEQKLKIEKIYLKGLQINLIQKTAQKTNWNNLFNHSTKTNQPHTGSSTVKAHPSAAIASAPLAFTIAGLNVQNANVVYTNEQTHQKTQISSLNFRIGKLSPGKSSPLNLAFIVNTNHPQLTIHTHLKALINANWSQKTYRLTQIHWTWQAHGHHVLKHAEKALLQGAITTKLEGNGLVKLQNLSFKVGHTHVNGFLSFQNFHRPLINFHFSANLLDVTRLMSLLSTSSAPATQSSASSQPTTTTNKPTAIHLPVALMRKVHMDGSVDIANADIQKISFQKIQLNCQAAHGIFSINHLSAGFSGGFINATGIINVRHNIPHYQATASLTGIHMGPVIKALYGQSYLSGLATMHINLATQGNNFPSLKRQMTGRASMAMNKGSFLESTLAKKLVLASQIIQAIHAHKSWQNLISQNSRSVSGNQANFMSMNATANIKNGVINNTDLLINAVKFRATGHGTVNMLSKKVNYLLNLRNSTGTGTTIPLHIVGSLNHLSYQLELNNIAQQLLRKKIHHQINKTVQQFLSHF